MLSSGHEAAVTNANKDGVFPAKNCLIWGRIIANRVSDLPCGAHLCLSSWCRKWTRINTFGYSPSHENTCWLGPWPRAHEHFAAKLPHCLVAGLGTGILGAALEQHNFRISISCLCGTATPSRGQTRWRKGRLGARLHLTPTNTWAHHATTPVWFDDGVVVAVGVSEGVAVDVRECV